jgi:hypothetical protein
MLLCFTKCYCVLLKITVLLNYTVLLNVPAFSWNLLRVTKCYWVLLNITVFCYRLLCVTEIYCVTACYCVLLNITVLLNVTVFFWMLMCVWRNIPVLKNVTVWYWMLVCFSVPFCSYPWHFVTVPAILWTVCWSLIFICFVFAVRRFEPGRSRWVSQAINPRLVSFGGELKPSVPCRRFAACKSSLRFTWNTKSQAKLTVHYPPNSVFTNRGLSCRLTWSPTGDDGWHWRRCTKGRYLKGLGATGW